MICLLSNISEKKQKGLLKTKKHFQNILQVTIVYYKRHSFQEIQHIYLITWKCCNCCISISSFWRLYSSSKSFNVCFFSASNERSCNEKEKKTNYLYYLSYMVCGTLEPSLPSTDNPLYMTIPTHFILFPNPPRLEQLFRQYRPNEIPDKYKK